VNFAALFAGSFKRCFHRFKRALIHERPHQHALARRVADDEILVHRKHAIAQLIGDRLVRN
jgi:hypothetical protein